jgi:hypothetical protein
VYEPSYPPSGNAALWEATYWDPYTEGGGSGSYINNPGSTTAFYASPAFSDDSEMDVGFYTYAFLPLGAGYGAYPNIYF